MLLFLFRGLNKVEFLSLRSNRLTNLVPNAFGGIAGKRDVCFNNDNCRVDLTENDISEVGANAFAWTKHISITLGQGHADMKVKSYAFNGLKSTHKVYIYDIPSVEIEPRAFTNVEDMDLLEVSSTLVKTIESFTFEGMKEIDKILFSDCVIEGIEPYGFSGISYRPDPDAMAYVDFNSTGTSAQELSGGELKLTSCNISYLPTDMCRDTNLATLTIEDNDLLKINQNAFRGQHGLKVLQFIGNNIPTLTEKSFGTLKNVWEILIHGNNLTDIDPRAFLDTHEIRRLSIGESPDNILHLHSEAFSGLMDIEHFRLSSQASLVIAPDAFDNMLGVHLFEITDTFMPVLREGAFRGLNRVNFMRLHDCGISRLEEGVFGLEGGRGTVREVDLTKGNSLACGCDIADIMQVYHTYLIVSSLFRKQIKKLTSGAARAEFYVCHLRSRPFRKTQCSLESRKKISLVGNHHLLSRGLS